MICLQDLRGQLLRIAEVPDGLLFGEPASGAQIDVLCVFGQNILLLRFLQDPDAGLQFVQEFLFVHSRCSFKNALTCCEKCSHSVSRASRYKIPAAVRW